MMLIEKNTQFFTLLVTVVFIAACNEIEPANNERAEPNSQPEVLEEARGDDLALSVKNRQESVGGEAVVSMCLDSKRPRQVCLCAAKSLAEKYRDDEFILYDRVADDYRKKIAQGQRSGDAWDGAVKSVSDEDGLSWTKLTARMNPLGLHHRISMGRCEGKL